MTPHISRLRAKELRAAQAYRRATSDRLRLRKVWVRAVAAVMVAEMRYERRRKSA